MMMMLMMQMVQLAIWQTTHRTRVYHLRVVRYGAI